MSEERITELEIRVAELERVNEDLSRQLADQWKVVEASRARMDELVRRFLTVEAAVQPEIPVDKPPHW
ncbi:MAG: SlyX family protein [Notoacmeibacter sp.]|nr:SlyX family protein [Notoacmeibacter sp.]MCC0032469.1 SlyX family protein [Brucellaceae bacterium]